MLFAPSTPRTHAEDDAERADRERELEVVRRELARPVAERLQRRDLLALRPDDAREEHVQEERGDAEEDDGERPRDFVELADLLVDQPARWLVGAAHRAETAVRLQDRVHPLRSSPARPRPPRAGSLRR